LSWVEELDTETKDKVENILKETHERFIQHVEEKRGPKLSV